MIIPGLVHLTENSKLGLVVSALSVAMVAAGTFGYSLTKPRDPVNSPSVSPVSHSLAQAFKQLFPVKPSPTPSSPPPSSSPSPTNGNTSPNPTIIPTPSPTLDQPTYSPTPALIQTTTAPTTTPKPSLTLTLPEPTGVEGPTATPQPSQSITVSLNPDGNFTPNAGGQVNLTVTQSSGGFITFNASGNLSGLMPNRHYSVNFCGQNCTTMANPEITTDNQGQTGFTLIGLSQNQAKDPLNRIKVWEVVAAGPAPTDNTVCWAESLNSPACLAAALNL